MLPCHEHGDKAFTFVLVTHVALTLSFSDQEQVLHLVVLLAFDLLGLAIVQVELLDQEVLNTSIHLENHVLL